MRSYNTNELCHHGVKGQKWGVRRYKNSDGTLTAAGKKKYAKLDNVRNSEADRYKRMYESEKRSFEINKKQAKELRQQGHRGKSMKDMYGFTDDKTAMEMHGSKMKDLWELELYERNHQANLSRDRVEAYDKAYNQLKNLDLTMVRNRKDIVRLGKNTVNDVFNAQDPEDEIYY